MIGSRIVDGLGYDDIIKLLVNSRRPLKITFMRLGTCRRTCAIWGQLSRGGIGVAPSTIADHHMATSPSSGKSTTAGRRNLACRKASSASSSSATFSTSSSASRSRPVPQPRSRPVPQPRSRPAPQATPTRSRPAPTPGAPSTASGYARPATGRAGAAAFAGAMSSQGTGRGFMELLLEVVQCPVSCREQLRHQLCLNDALQKTLIPGPAAPSRRVPPATRDDKEVKNSPSLPLAPRVRESAYEHRNKSGRRQSIS